MFFGLFGRKKKAPTADPWQLETLGDFWAISRIMEQARQNGEQNQVMTQYFKAMTRAIEQTIERYPLCVQTLDQLANGIYSDPKVAAKCGLKLPPGTTLLQNLHNQRRKLQKLVNPFMELEGDAFNQAWSKTIDHSGMYIRLLSTLVQDFGNFEVLIVQLPGLGDMTASKPVQIALAEMFEINTRNIRMMEFISDLRKAWAKGESSTGFFKPETDLGLMLKEMCAEYMREADPMLIAAKQKHAQKTGKPFRKYRFWRPAETFRQMSQVAYGPPPKRVPKPRRPYTAIHARDDVPGICADVDRLQWVFKEIFNNAIAATSTMTKTEKGLVARPLKRHMKKQPTPAIQLSAEPFTVKTGWFSKQQMVRVIIADDGVGMEPELAARCHLWAYSSRRAEFGKQKAGAAAALIIGGKGIGLAFSTALIQHHGGELRVQSVEGKGTKIIIELPTPTPFTI